MCTSLFLVTTKWFKCNIGEWVMVNLQPAEYQCKGQMKELSK